MKGGSKAAAFETVIPIFRIFDLEKARQFYIDFLGFKENWLHRFAENMPAYVEVERDGFRIHLSEHHGDGTPGSSVYVIMKGVKQFHEEISANDYGYLNPGIEKTFQGTLCVDVIDPFNNRISFNEELLEK